METYNVPLWAKIVLVFAMIAGSDPTSEPVINHLACFRLGKQIEWAMAINLVNGE